MIPRTISFIFIFWNHIFLLSLVPCCLKSCACKIIYELRVTKMIANNLKFFQKSQLWLKRHQSFEVQCEPNSVFESKETKKNNTMSEIYYSLHHLKKLIDTMNCVIDIDMLALLMICFYKHTRIKRYLRKFGLLMLLTLNNIVYNIPDLPFKSCCDNVKRKCGKMQTHMNHIPITTFHSM